MEARLPDGQRVRAIAISTKRASHPDLHNANDVHAQQLSRTERFCKRIAESTGAPITLVAVIILQIVWIVVGTATKMDPFPYIFMLTVSNVIQLVLIVVLAVAGRQQSLHDSIRAEEDHHALSLILQRLDKMNAASVVRVNSATAASFATIHHGRDLNA
jgi:uncharacterized membrane protein